MAGRVRGLVNDLLLANEERGEVTTGRVARAALAAVETLAREASQPGGGLQAQLLGSTGLSAPMIDWALRIELGQVNERALGRLVSWLRPSQRRRPVPARLVACVLAGNVFTAPLRAVLLPLLTGAPVLAKASSGDDVLVRRFARALNQADGTVGARLRVVTFDREATRSMQALLETAEVASVYGSDPTVKSIRQMMPAGSRFLAHGHGLGAVYLPAPGVRDKRSALSVARKVALDVAAYDQRGCLSPHFVCVQQRGAVSAERFARMLAEQGLGPVGEQLPRGRLHAAASAAQMQWRGVAEAREALFAGKDHAVSYEGWFDPRPSPGYRNVSVYKCRDTEQLARGLSFYGERLKALGVAGDREQRARVAACLRGAVAPRICAVGQMQKPPLDALADGRHPLEGLVRWVQVE